MENSKKYGEIGEMGWPTTGGGSANGEFEEIWRNRDNRMTGSEHGPMFIKTLPFTNLKQHTKTPRYKTTHISTVWPYRATLRP